MMRAGTILGIRLLSAFVALSPVTSLAGAPNVAVDSVSLNPTVFNVNASNTQRTLTITWHIANVSSDTIARYINVEFWFAHAGTDETIPGNNPNYPNPGEHQFLLRPEDPSRSFLGQVQIPILYDSSRCLFSCEATFQTKFVIPEKLYWNDGTLINGSAVFFVIAQPVGPNPPDEAELVANFPNNGNLTDIAVIDQYVPNSIPGLCPPEDASGRRTVTSQRRR